MEVDCGAWTLCGVTQATRRREWCHTNLFPLAYLLEHPSWARWMARRGHGAAGDWWRLGGVGWADGHGDAGSKQRNEHRGRRTRPLDERRVRE
jgi:hypothetical protein